MENNEVQEKKARILQSFEPLLEQYFILCVGAEDVRMKYYKIAGGNAELPIPVRTIAQTANILGEKGIKVVERDLSILSMRKYKPNTAMPIGMILGKLEYDSNGDATIHVERGISSFRKNYVIAHELGDYWLQKNLSLSPKNVLGKCVDTQLPIDPVEILSDIFSVFLLLPIDDLFSAEVEYLYFNNRRPVNLEEILSYISDIAEIPYYYVLIGYEYIRMVICYIREKTKEELDSMCSKEPLLSMKDATMRVIEQIQQIDKRFFEQVN